MRGAKSQEGVRGTESAVVRKYTAIEADTTSDFTASVPYVLGAKLIQHVLFA